MTKTETDMRPVYKRSDFSKLERGQFFAEVAKGPSIAVMNPDIAKALPPFEAANTAVHGPLTLTQETVRLTPRPKRTSSKGARRSM